MSYESDPSMDSSPASSIASVGSFPRPPPPRELAPILLGRVLVEGHSADTLFDTGASHCFISEAFIDAIGIPTQVLDTLFMIGSVMGVISIPNRRGEAGVTLLHADQNRNIGFLVPFRVMQTRDYDLILGVDWMRESRTLIDMEDHKISVWTQATGRELFQLE